MQQRPGGGFQQQPNMGTPPGPQMMPRPQQQAPYSPMRQGGMPPQTSKRPSDNRPPPQQSKGAPARYLFINKIRQTTLLLLVLASTWNN